MDISPRHRMILKALIEDFVSGNKPVGSKTLSTNYDFGLSPATIRSVFRDLEGMGYIHSLHHSGGRVPTEYGYRFYVDSLLSLYELTVKEKQRIQEEYLKNQLKLDQILIATCRVLSTLSNTAAVVFAPEKEYVTLKHIELVHVTGEEILMILVMRTGTVVNRNLFVRRNFSQESLYRVSKFLNDHLKGFDLNEIKLRVLSDLQKTSYGPSEFYEIAEILQRAFEPDQSDENLYIDGLKNLWNNFRDDEKDTLENVLLLLDTKGTLKEYFAQYINTDGVHTYIGEREDEQMCGVSIVASSYRMGEKKIGSMGIIGPQRMDYTRALPLVEFTSKLVSEMLTKLSK
ncbi:MAG: heat-inducible transcriptional repressor HrcA [Leptospiraceae bacterium]|nr:heat-inducible transcription repressor HrcA [Leptospiraceae bacterium]MCK6380177.1 heat-inducible transcriptional repressor HrcA [Leptospiraceae bacterium]NUM41207.1 heat-inducible transcription repressor HrcA [Leptospiraceae bacterium]